MALAHEKSLLQMRPKHEPSDPNANCLAHGFNCLQQTDIRHGGSHFIEKERSDGFSSG